MRTFRPSKHFRRKKLSLQTFISDDFFHLHLASLLSPGTDHLPSPSQFGHPALWLPLSNHSWFLSDHSCYDSLTLSVLEVYDSRSRTSNTPESPAPLDFCLITWKNTNPDVCNHLLFPCLPLYVWAPLEKVTQHSNLFHS